MRPIRLELKGFTAFRDEQAIDFEGLDLFAIAGPTGSGKSSILDAMTYALYGYVERVGKQVSQLISQGQPRMAVTLEFAVGDRRFRVTRSTPAKGATKILLERWEDGDWRQAGEGADRVRDADAMIEGALGLDYAAFTRSVLLPQGTFAEFLVGEAKDRRKILTELLGLDLFVRLAERAGALRRDAEVEVRAKATVLETEYAGVTEEVVAEAEGAAASAAARDEALAEAEAKVREVADRWAEAARAIRDLEACAGDARESAGVAGSAARSLEGIAERHAQAEGLVKERTKVAANAAKNAEGAETARAEAEAEWGRAQDLGALRARAEGLAEAREEVADVETELKEAREARPKLEKALAAAERLVATHVADAEAALLALGAAKTAVDEAQHADLVAAVRAGVHPGDRCPVCGAHVESLPKASRAPSLVKARAALAKAEEQATAASDALGAARTESDEAERELRAADREAQRLERDLAKRTKDLSVVEAALGGAMGGTLPVDPVAALEERIERLEKLGEVARHAAEAAADAREERTEAARRCDALAAEFAEERGRLHALPVAGVLDRARTLADVPVPGPPHVAGAKDAASLGRLALELAEGLEALADALDERAALLAGGEGEMLAEGTAAMEGLVAPAASLDRLVEDVAAERRRAAATAATAGQRAELLRTKLENARALAEEIAAQRVRAERFDALTKELRADRIIAFLQLEALEILAAAGSEHLSTLSDGRYRLAFQGDEFFVIDTWNGEEQRSARTLSGGETFLASLALALALSEQVRSLSLAEKARLDSLFLDEGFGTLDPETLEIVVEAIEQLGGDGRMVGVITHVQELAIRLPTRIEVEKSPRGSRLQVVA